MVFCLRSPLTLVTCHVPQGDAMKQKAAAKKLFHWPNQITPNFWETTEMRTKLIYPRFHFTNFLSTFTIWVLGLSLPFGYQKVTIFHKCSHLNNSVKLKWVCFCGITK